jgi:hypothetical protein
MTKPLEGVLLALECSCGGKRDIFELIKLFFGTSASSVLESNLDGTHPCVNIMIFTGQFG